MRSLNEIARPEEVTRRIAELSEQVTELIRRLEVIEDARGERAQQSELTFIGHDDDENSIQFHTENGFVIVRPWETNGAATPAAGAFRFRVQDPEGNEREVTVEISSRLRNEMALRSRDRIETSGQFWICSAERRLANYLMEHGEFPPANEMIVDELDREDVLLAIRWEKTT